MSISLEKFTLLAENALLFAQQYAKEHAHSKVEALHLLYSLITQDDSMVKSYFKSMDIPTDSLFERIQAELGKIPKADPLPEEAFISRNLHAILLRAEKEAFLMQHEYTQVEHLLLGLLLNESPAKTLLGESGVTLEQVHHLIFDVINETQDTLKSSKTSDILDTYCVDLTQKALSSKLDPVVGREHEVRRLTQILCRYVKNNPILIGEPGVGKTAIAESLALRIAENDIPDVLKDRRLLSVDMAALVAGTSHRGEFEERFKSLIQAVEDSSGEIILFFDEIHMLVGAGGSEGALDAANMIKPALSRGQLHCIGATTIKEFKKHIEKDPALVRRFQPIQVDEPNVSATIAILRGIKEKYELHHGVHITDNALVAAAQLSDRYVTDRYLPDKAIDLVDEAAAIWRIQADSVPIEVDQMERQIRQLEIEKNSLQDDANASTGNTSQERLSEIQSALSSLQEQSRYLRKRWQAEREQLKKLNLLKEAISRAGIEEKEAQKHGDFEKASHLRYDVLEQLQGKLKKAHQKLGSKKSKRLMKEEVDDEDIASVVSEWTGIPVSKMLEGERDKLLHMEKGLEERVIGQQIAVSCVCNSIRRSRAGVQDPQRPIGSFIFIGGSGVGKTELAYALAEFLFDHQQSLIRFDMSEYSEKQSSTRLIGPPPGYVGFEEGGLLTEAIKRRPYSVILFDEIEKAHQDVFDLFLQILDNGQLTDSQGHSVNFKNTIIILTTNLGYQAIKKEQKVANEEDLNKVAQTELLKHFRPEFLNRIDDVVVFHDLSLSHIHQICTLQLQKIEAYLREQHIELEVSEQAKTYLAQRGYDSSFGARPLKRTLQKYIQDPIANQLLEGHLNHGQRCVISVEHGKLQFTVKDSTR